MDIVVLYILVNLLTNELVDSFHFYRWTELTLNHTHRSLTIYKGALPLGLQLAPGLRPSCSDEYEVPFAEFPRDDCVVAPCFGLGLVFV